MKNILILCCSGGKGGTGNSANELALILCKSYKVHVVAENDFILESFHKIENANLIVHSAEKGRKLAIIIRNTFYLKKIIKTWDIDLIITNTNKDALYSALLNLLFVKVPRLIYVRDFQWIYRNFIWRFNPKSAILVPSEALLERENYIPNTNITVIQNVTVVPDFFKVEQNISGTFPAIPIVLHVANIAKLKGTIYLIQSFAIAKQKISNIRLCIVGQFVDKEYEKECLNLAKKLGIDSSIDYVNYTNNMKEQYEKCSMVVSSSISEFGGPETFGRTIIEGWSFAKPVISFACGGPKYIIESGVDGFLVPEKDIEAMAEKIVLLAQNRELAGKMGLAGLKTVKDKYSAEAVEEQLKKIIGTK